MKRRRRNPMKYRMMDEPAPKRVRDRGSDFKVVAVLAMIGVGIYFAWSKDNGGA